jgi:hypothetical protein
MRHIAVSLDVFVISFAEPAEFCFASKTGHMIASVIFLNSPTAVFPRTLPTRLFNLLFARLLRFQRDASVVFRACKAFMPRDFVFDAGAEVALRASEYRI